jgi:hypothetical protein
VKVLEIPVRLGQRIILFGTLLGETGVEV